MVIKEEGQTLLAWRNVPVVRENIGELARSVEPVIRQVFIGRGANCPDENAFERKLYIIRRRVQNIVANLASGTGRLFLRQQPVVPNHYL